MRRFDSNWLNFTLAGLLGAGVALAGCNDDSDFGAATTGGSTNGGFAGGTTGNGGGTTGSIATTSGVVVPDAGLTPDASEPIDGGGGGCTAPHRCAPGEETYESLEECEAAGPGCVEYLDPAGACIIGDGYNYCRPSDCEGSIVPEGPSCEPDGFCYLLGAGQFCTGERGSCAAGARPIAADVPCPKGHLCADEPDGQRCATKQYADTEACLAVGSYAYATPPIGALVPCDEGDTTLGWISGFEPSLCCIDNDGNHGKAGCEAMDAEGVGLCDAFFGYAWDGEACVGLSGCSCEGTACGETYQSPFDCQEDYRALECLPPDCRTTGCDAGESCEVCWSGYACIPEGAVC